MNTATHDAHPGNLVRARHREGVVKAADNQHNDGSQLLSIAQKRQPAARPAWWMRWQLHIGTKTPTSPHKMAIPCYRFRLIRAAMAALLALACAAQALAQAERSAPLEGPAGLRRLMDLPYGDAPAQRMDVYLPPTAMAHAPVPAILLVHGGAWRMGHKAHGGLLRHKIRHWVMQAGFALVSVEYRLLPQANPLEQAQDVARALAQAQRLSPGWGVDASQWVLMGHSAGAHLVALLSADPVLAQGLGADPWLGTVLLDSAALDVPALMERRRHPRLYDDAFGPQPDFWAQASPLQRLTRTARPMLAVCSSMRPDSPCQQAQAFAQRAQALGVPVDVLPQALSHQEVNTTLGQDGAYTQAVDDFLATLHPALAQRLK